MSAKKLTADWARAQLPLAWDQYQASRLRLSQATAAYLRAKRLIRVLMQALGKDIPPGPWHKRK